MGMTEHEIQRTAQQLIDRHGDDAPGVASRRAEELAAAGDLEGAAGWQAVAARIRDLRTLVVPFAIC
jgi:hypothetical protein